MGSAKLLFIKPQTMEKKSLNPFSLVKSWIEKAKKKEKPKEKETEKQNDQKETKAYQKPEATVASILETFKDLNIKKETTVKNDRNKTITKDNDNELDHFTFEVIKENRIGNRTHIQSQSSEDSGFADHDVVETLQNLTIHDKETEGEEKEKDKKTRQLLVKRTPIRNKVSDYSAHPYAKSVDTACKPINQVNKQTLSGGQVIVNTGVTDNLELDVALDSVAKIYQSDPAYWEDVLDVISKDNDLDILSEFPIDQVSNIDVVPEQASNPLEEITLQNINGYDLEFNNSIMDFGFRKNDIRMFPTPPRSENVSSPLSESQAFYPSHSDCTLSPESSSPIYSSDFEKYQEISPLSNESFEDKDTKRDMDRASQMSQSSMTMKNFKDLQKDIANSFSKKECCDTERKSSFVIFEEHRLKLKAVERKNLCLKVSKLDLETAYGVLHKILVALSKECKDEDLHYTLFALICQRVLAQTPALFVEDFGLGILKAAALRCPHRPLLTRHIVHCVYMVLRSNPKLCSNECVFHEVDAQGDTLLSACARAGDAHAPVLAELTRCDARGDLPPLFRLHHFNADGYTALQVACREHSATSPRLHTVHVLLEHADADMWKGDIKGGDTALHLAVNSSTCCLQLVMLLFKHQDRKMWKKLAHAPNMSSTTPLDYARSAAKSTTRQNYPHEVLDFLKKCR